MMRGRFNKSGGSAVSFFAFQDVITGTTGFLIIITIFLALNLDEAISTTHPSPDATPAVSVALQETLEDIVTLKGQLATSQPAPGETRETLLRMIEELKQAIDRLSLPTDAKNKPGQETPLDREIRIEVRKLQTRLDELQKLLPDAQEKATQAEATADQRQGEVKDATSRVEQSIASKNVLRLIPERSTSSKEPLVLVVTRSSYKLQFFDTKPAQTFGTMDEMATALQPYPGSQYYLVLFFKPSGSTHFHDLTQALRSGGYEIGYDLLAEETELETAAPQ